MMTTPVSAIEKIIRDYIENKQKSILHNKRSIDLEKEYNKQLTMYNGEAKNYTLEQADRIYEAYQEMVVSSEEAKIAKTRFEEDEEKLRELGNILFEATIHAEISMTALNGEAPVKRPVKVAYYSGEVVIS